MPKVYRFKKYDIGTDETITSKRWATREAIERLLGKEAQILEHTEVEVDASALDDNGMTARNFDPHATTGFQTRMKA